MGETDAVPSVAGATHALMAVEADGLLSVRASMTTNAAAFLRGEFLHDRAHFRDLLLCEAKHNFPLVPGIAGFLLNLPLHGQIVFQLGTGRELEFNEFTTRARLRLAECAARAAPEQYKLTNRHLARRPQFPRT